MNRRIGGSMNLESNHRTAKRDLRSANREARTAKREPRTQTYSFRSATAGAIRVARRAGT
jgi:hypothetical protein